MKLPWPTDKLPPIESFLKHPGVRTIRHGDLLLFNYTEKQNFSGVWDDVTMAARGLIADIHGNIVAWPFGKFFNAGQTVTINGVEWTAPSMTNECRQREKLDGSLIIGFRYDDDNWRMITRGSFHSQQAQYAIEISDQFYRFSSDQTVMFELVGPRNRHVIKYEHDALYLLGWRDGVDSLVYIPEMWGYYGFRIPQDWTEDESEGFVAIHPDGTMVKHKTDYYLESVKAIGALRHFAEAWQDGTHAAAIEKMPAHYAAVARTHAAALDAAYAARLHYLMDAVPKSFTARGDFARWVNANAAPIDRHAYFAISDYMGIGVASKGFSAVASAVRHIVASESDLASIQLGGVSDCS